MAAACVGGARKPTTADASAFLGRWAYAQSCGWQHSAELELVAANDGVRGTWNDGTRVGGDDGELRGVLRDGRVYLGFCSSSAQRGGSVCPQFGAQDDAYLVREGDRLGWYRRQGDASARYLVLHRVVAGAEIPIDDDCSDDAATP